MGIGVFSDGSITPSSTTVWDEAFERLSIATHQVELREVNEHAAELGAAAEGPDSSLLQLVYHPRGAAVADAQGATSSPEVTPTASSLGGQVA
jgi:hypothetical protein